ncbi:unnamed protein product [Rotaria socialis]
MEDRDGKKAFTIPKTCTSNKDVLIPEKTGSRNVTELFDDIKSCALEAHFDFRKNACKSCETIRNQKLQKLYNERKIQMKKTQDSTERFAFHLITSRDSALSIANDGLMCEQLSFSIDQYLGNPKDGVHLSRRPDVLLASTGAQGLHKFGLLICKIILGKGYATIPSANNKQFSAQLHYDHHFCKIQPSNKEQRNIDNLLAKSLIFCYEYNDLETVSHPSQILPLAILWYDLKEKFSSKLVSTSQESRKNHEKMNNSKNLNKTKPLLSKPISKPMSLLNTGTWVDLTSDITISPEKEKIPPTQTMPNQYPTQLMLSFSSFSNLQQIANYRDPRLARTVTSSETIPLSPRTPIHEKSQLDISLSTKPTVLAKRNPLTVIPLNSKTKLIDPRVQSDKSKHHVFYLESQAVKHALQQQKRLNNYHNSKNNTKPKTSYTLIPFTINSISLDEYESSKKVSNQSLPTDHSPLCISVVDYFHFGLKPKNNKLYIDLEENENRFAYEQINISNHLIERQKQLGSQEIRLQLRERGQRKMDQFFNQHNKFYSANSKLYVNAGRKFLKNHVAIASSSSDHKISSELLDFFSYEYQSEERSHVKHLLAELIGVFVEKYGLENKQIISKHTQDEAIEGVIMEGQTINDVIDMDLASPSSQGLGDYDERFRVQTPPSSINNPIYNQLATSLPLSQTLPAEANKMFDELNSNSIEIAQPLRIDLPLSLSKNYVDLIDFKPKLEKLEFSSNENNTIEDNHPLLINANSKQIMNSNSLINIDDDSNRSRDEFVKLLTKEVYTSKPSSPSKVLNHHRRSYDNDESNINKNLLSTRTVTLVSNCCEDNLIIETKNIDERNTDEEPTVKRIKITPADDIDSPIKVIDDHDYRKDLDERKRQARKKKRLPHSRSPSKSTSSRNSSIRKSKTRSPSSSSSRASSISNRYRQQQQQQQKEYKYKYNRSSDRSYHSYQRDISSSNSIRLQTSHHQRFNYNHQSVADHPRFSNVNTVSSPIKSLMDDSLNTSNYSQSITDYSDRSSITNINRVLNSSYCNELPSNYQHYPDDRINNPPKLQPLMSARPIVDFSTSYDTKPSSTIERLQMFLQNQNRPSYEHEQPSIRDYSSSSSVINPPQNSNDSSWPSSRYS